jgi:hypothetical protein
MSAHPTPASNPEGRPRGLALTAVVIAVVLQLVVAVPFTVGTGLLTPLWGIVAAWALWLTAVAALILTARHRPLLAPVIPLANAGVLFALVAFGESDIVLRARRLGELPTA